MFFISLVAAVLVGAYAASALSARARTPYAVKETHYVPNKWNRIGAPDPDHIINLQVGLKQSSFNELQRHLNEVSDPDHSRYGRHLSKAEVEELVRPSAETSDLVHEWLSDNGIELTNCSFSPANDWVLLMLRLVDVEELLSTSYSIYRHEDGTILTRTTEWSLPLHLHNHVSTIQPTTAFLKASPNRVPARRDNEIIRVSGQMLAPDLPETYASIDAICDFSAVTPGCLRTLYGTVDYTPQVPGENRIGLNNFLGQTNNRSDTRIFLKKFRPEAASAADNFTQISIAGGTLQQTPNYKTGEEGNLDIQTIIGITWPTVVTSFSTGGKPPFIPDLNTASNTNEPYLEWANFALGQSSLPQVISTSYGEDEQSVPYSYAATVCGLFAQLGARGVSLLFSSGDFGVGAHDTCYSNDGKNTPTFLSSFPASCPYVTAVGATRDFPERIAFNAQSKYVSGSGFSNYFVRPSYQDEVVPSYIASLNGMHDGLYNKSGRAFPDIAAQGYHFETVWNGTILGLDGTSCSAPVASSVISLVNDALIAAGKPVLGFLNPWLYKAGYKAFTDVVNGFSFGCSSTGFPTGRGWDVASGFGTPYFPDILEIALSN